MNFLVSPRKLLSKLRLLVVRLAPIIIIIIIIIIIKEEAYNPNEEGQHVFQSLSPD